LVVLFSLAGQQPKGIDARHHHQLENDLGGCRDAGLVIQPGRERDIEGVSQFLAAMLAVLIFTNLAEPFGQAYLLPASHVVPPPARDPGSTHATWLISSSREGRLNPKTWRISLRITGKNQKSGLIPGVSRHFFRWLQAIDFESSKSSSLGRPPKQRSLA
jgi:hypothetical protein